MNHYPKINHHFFRNLQNQFSVDLAPPPSALWIFFLWSQNQTSRGRYPRPNILWDHQRKTHPAGSSWEKTSLWCKMKKTKQECVCVCVDTCLCKKYQKYICHFIHEYCYLIYALSAPRYLCIEKSPWTLFHVKRSKGTIQKLKTKWQLWVKMYWRRSVKNHLGDLMENELFKMSLANHLRTWITEHESWEDFVQNHCIIGCELPVKSTVYLIYGHLGYHNSGNTSHGQ